MTCALFRRDDYFWTRHCSRLLNSSLIYFFYLNWLVVDFVSAQLLCT
ncbi:hypothetical protein M6B38_251105 [Iris pallida]|uniref:Uncharacterized protein n=1 Tax=Iris pallida TaxID=29817 RepID=A0AAX6IJJ6_IRIPA|nr:hypothetical protein M6B38_251105 [Iris pallida]